MRDSAGGPRVAGIISPLLPKGDLGGHHRVHCSGVGVPVAHSGGDALYAVG